ncbi:unnamed protein product [Schistosoma curassoni]|uniref:Peptidase A2 domain-containing protein n=1 Tax=Schistosoma curassoni TaxID=6186 RepID=A0A183KFA7_9TREM|nr:unnamed protein product [Schistosoma curassoni]
MKVYSKQQREFGKWASQTVVAAPVTDSLFHIRDRISGSDILVDKGAEISIVPLQLSRRRHRTEDSILLRFTSLYFTSVVVNIPGFPPRGIDDQPVADDDSYALKLCTTNASP